MRFTFILTLYLLSQLLTAGELLNAVVEHKDKRYFIKLDMLIDADPGRVHKLLTDYNKLGRLNDSIKTSEIVYSLNERTHRVRVVTKACVLFFCKTIRQMQDVEQLDNNIIVATVIPEQSDFDYAHARWSIRREKDRTRVTFNADLKPSFWVPPLIGPPVIKKKLYNETLDTIETVERLAKQHDTKTV
ncbi:MAG: SRPBCC family protein, partial [Granulosicoccaceae bacterium]